VARVGKPKDAQKKKAKGKRTVVRDLKVREGAAKKIAGGGSTNKWTD
jgi:hypothetical protein